MINHNAWKSSDFLKNNIWFAIYDKSYLIYHVMYFGLKHVKIKYAYLSMQIIKYVDLTI